MQAENNADLITLPEAAKRIGIHRDTMYRLARTGQFPPAIRVGTRWRVSVPRLERWLHGEPRAGMEEFITSGGTSRGGGVA